MQHDFARHRAGFLQRIVFQKLMGGRGVGDLERLANWNVQLLRREPAVDVVGTHALQCAVGAGARVTVLDKNVDRLRQLDLVFGNRITTQYSNAMSVEEAVLAADLVIGGVLIPGAAAPKLVTRDMIARMRKGAVVVDVAIDQGGCFETSHATTHADPVYVVDGVTHYCVANMPGAVPITSTKALTNATLPYVEAIAGSGLHVAVASDPALAKGVNVIEGKLTYEAVAEAHGIDYTPLDDVLPLAAVRG